MRHKKTLINLVCLFLILSLYVSTAESHEQRNLKNQNLSTKTTLDSSEFISLTANKTSILRELEFKFFSELDQDQKKQLNELGYESAVSGLLNNLDAEPADIITFLDTTFGSKEDFDMFATLQLNILYQLAKRNPKISRAELESFKNKIEILTVSLRGKVVGLYSYLIFNEFTVEGAGIYVHDKFRGRGIGRALREFLYQHLRDRGYQEFLMNGIDETKEAQGFQKATLSRIGFKMDQNGQVSVDLESYVKKNNSKHIVFFYKFA